MGVLCSELRIGNKIQDRNGFVFNVVGIGEDWITTDFESNEGYAWEFNFKTNPPTPIELTEEILLKCGFAEFYKSDFSVKLECIKNPIFEFVRRNHKDWNLRIKGETHKHIKYLHQLQNLYFALTGKELEIEL